MFASLVGIAVVGLLYMALKMNNETTTFIAELQFFLRHRIIAHNQVKAKMAVLETQFHKLQQENFELHNQIRKFKVENGFDGMLSETEFVEEDKNRLQELSTNLG